MLIINISLSDIPKDAITTGKNGKQYISVVVDQRREKDQYDNTHTVYVNQSKEDRQNKKPKQYIGNGKEYTF